MLNFKQTRILRQDLELHSEFISSCLIHSEQYVRDNMKKILQGYKWNFLFYGGEYDSIMDMILCNLFPFYKKSCAKFYQGRGMSMRGSYSKYQIIAIDSQLPDQLQIIVGRID